MLINIPKALRFAHFYRHCPGLFGLLLAVSASTFAETNQYPATTRADALKSVGRLTVPAIRYRDGYPEHFVERCSATLITPLAQPGATRLVISAWHCVEHYRDLSRAPIFEAANGQQSEARVVVSGGSMHSDWVLLRLREPMHGAVSILDQSVSAPQTGLLMAGYPRDVEVSDSGISNLGQPDLRDSVRKLEASKPCEITGQLNRDQRSNCVLRKGASGGAVFSEDLNYAYLGVISQGDQISQSVFVPVARFRARINAYLEPQPGR